MVSKPMSTILPSASAAVFRLRPADLPECPRAVDRILAIDIVAGGRAGLSALICLAAAAGGYLWMGWHLDLRNYHREHVSGSAVVESATLLPGENSITYRVVAKAHVEQAEQTVIDDGADVVSCFDEGSVPSVPEAVPLLLANERGDLVWKGGRQRPVPLFDLTAQFTILLIMLAMYLWSVRQGLRHLTLLREGQIGEARLVSRDVVLSGKSTTNRLRFVFQDRHGKARKLVHRTPNPTDLVDDDFEPLLYDDHSAALLDGLPGRPRVVEGRFTASRPWRSRAAVGFVFVASVSTLSCVTLSLLLAWR